MLGMVLSDTPQWVIDGKNIFAMVAAFATALGAVWRYGIKPYLVHREAERRREQAEADEKLAGKIRAAVIPFEEQMRRMQKDVERISDKTLLLGDAIHGANTQIHDFAEATAKVHEKFNVRLDELTAGQESLHRDIRTHMETEDAQRGKDNGP